MASEDIEFCIHSECTNKECERHPSQIKQKWLYHSFMDLRGIICKGWSTAEDFGWKCPYTDKHCDMWNCSECKVNSEEERWMRMHEGESRVITDETETKWQKRIEAIKDDILRYKSDCGLSAFGLPKCERCNEVMFGSILRIIDKHTKGEPDGHN